MVRKINISSDKKNNKSSSLLETLKERFEKNISRHKGIRWEDVQKKIELNPKKLNALAEMEKTGGEPDVVDYDNKTREYIFYDCSPESPKGRVSLCYDSDALKSRKEFKPKNSAMELASSMGVEILDESEYIKLQSIGEFDTKSSSWIKTPDSIRKLGGAIFADRRFGRVFIYHNGAESYYAGRGFRSSLRV